MYGLTIIQDIQDKAGRVECPEGGVVGYRGVVGSKKHETPNSESQIIGLREVFGWQKCSHPPHVPPSKELRLGYVQL